MSSLLNNNNNNNNSSGYKDFEPTNSFPLFKLPEELLFEVFSNLPQPDRLNVTVLNKKCYKVATKLIYRRIYLNDSNVVRSDYINIAINWTLLNIPSYLEEQDSREIANKKLKLLIRAFITNKRTLESVQWIRINWDLDEDLQRNILSLLCSNGISLQRLENVTDPMCNDIIANGKISSKHLTSMDMAPPHSLPELDVPRDYIPNLINYLDKRISTNLSHMTLFIDPVKLFNYLYHLKEKLTIVDLKLHWRREFYPSKYFDENNVRIPKLKKLNEIFDVRTLKTLTIISWNESLISREIEMMKEFKEFIYLEDLSLISIKQDINILIELFNRLINLKRLKMDFLEDYIPETTNPQIFLSILLNCKKLEFIDIRFEGIDSPIINLVGEKFEISQKCSCSKCNFTFNEILRKKIFLFPIDYYLSDVQDIAAKDIFKMMRYLSLLPYSKACDSYPSVRTQPMNLEAFVKKINENLVTYRGNRKQLLNVDKNKIVNVNDSTISSANSGNTNNTNNIDEDYDMDLDLESEIDIELDIDNILGQTSNQQNHTNETDTETSTATINTGGIGDTQGFISASDLSTYKENLLRLPHKPLTKNDIILLYHTLIHHFKTTYYTFLKGFPRLRFLMLNDIPTITMEENNERIFHPVFYHYGYTSNLHGWSKHSATNKNSNKNNDNDNDTVTKRATVI
ncbi:similar to Saccharomyces cerevisiae YJL149W DAS1 Putative SCF ubiquitin ligase F-box protein [Maudiozyma saulgeensis]|uniref:Similar to Saccharomyces cerevisiae YJL149W DAS1 Putative SCF ubiquitin ligase F-box protein n=1 Tax=Maudiozyma saulgeensis TaxID=1789683 RepID=A0A1X7RC79_9SACH|nr:similar to Saccharomyces cerevisiae YJL149W DAS1 Putative SCF ubiquitin ligase F-box protein [Kazachstania saulgeensis]